MIKRTGCRQINCPVAFERVIKYSTCKLDIFFVKGTGCLQWRWAEIELNLHLVEITISL